MMPLRLNELLERIRPAGTAGAASEGNGQREELDRAGEISDVARVLAGFEAEADAIIVAAVAEARRLAVVAQREAGTIGDAVPGRIAAVLAETAQAQEETTLREQASIAGLAEREVTRLNAQAAEMGSSVRDAALREIWSVLLDPPFSGENP